MVSVNTTNKFKFLFRHVSASQGHHQAYKEVPMNLDYYNLLTRIWDLKRLTVFLLHIILCVLGVRVCVCVAVSCRSTGVLISPWPDQEGKKLMFLSEWHEFPSTPCLAEKKKCWQLASQCCWNRARPWHASELVSFLVGLRNYQHPGMWERPGCTVGRIIWLIYSL